VLKNKLFVWALLLVLFVIPACGGNNGAPQAAKETASKDNGSHNQDKSAAPGAKSDNPPKKEPVELTVVTYAKSNFDEMFNEKVKQKFPNITFNNVYPDNPNNLGQKLDQMVVAGEKFDMVVGSTGIIDYLVSKQIPLDLTSLTKKHNLDLNTFEPAILKTAQTYGPHGELYMLPIHYSGPFVLMYNKDIFDKFAVPYPKDGLTWDEAYELAKRLTRTDGGTRYMGFSTPNHAWLNNQLSPSWVDPKTKKATLYTDPWIHIFTTYQRMFSIPGNNLVGGNPMDEKAFISDQNLAMLSIPNTWKKDSLKQSKVNWDMATMPVFPEKPNTATPVTFAGVSIASVSQHPDDAMDVVSYLLSEEMQKNYTEQSLELTVLSKREIQLALQNDPYLKDKNVAAIFKLHPADPYYATQYDSLIRQTIGTAFVNVVTGKTTDAHTALRNAEEAANQLLAAEQ
jgi:multiple sugar transport system substrate-binding protein